MLMTTNNIAVIRAPTLPQRTCDPYLYSAQETEEVFDLLWITAAHPKILIISNQPPVSRLDKLYDNAATQRV